MEVFVGAERLQQLTALTSHWEEACAEKKMRIIILRAPTRSGSTEFLRRLYGHCALSQTYWPTELQERDQLYPKELRLARDSNIPYLWWGLDAQPDGFALLDGAAQITAHLGALSQVVKTADTQTRTKLRTSLEAALLIGSLLPLGDVVSTVINIIDASVGVKPIAQQLAQAFTPQETMLATARSVRAGTTISIDGLAAAQQAAESEGLTHARLAAILPYAVVVDHAEHLDRPTIETLRTMCRHDGATGVIVLALDSDLEQLHGSYAGNRSLATWLDEQRRIDPEQIHEISLGPLTEDESITFAWHRLANRHGLRPADVYAARLAQVISVGGGRPGRLADLLDSRPVRHAITEPSAALPELERMTRSFALDQALAELPEAQRTALCSIGLHGPVVPRSWLPKLITDHVLRSLTDDWLYQDGGMVKFLSREFWNTVNNHVESLSDDEEDVIIKALSNRIAIAQHSGEWKQLGPSVAESLLTAVRDGLGIQEMPTDQLVDLLRSYRSTGRVEFTSRVVDKITARLAEPHIPLHQVVATAEALWDAGQTQLSLNTLQTAYDAALSKAGPRDAAVMPFLANLAAAWAALAQLHAGHTAADPYYERAENLINQLYNQRRLHLPSSDRRIPDALMQLARLHGSLHHPARAIEPAQQAISQYREPRCLGPEHRDIIDARESLARWRAEIDDLDQAIFDYRHLVADCNRVFGPLHENTLTARLNLAYHGLRSHQPDHYLSDLKTLVQDRALVYGNDHARTLTARSTLARYYWISEHYEVAATMMAEVVEGRERLLGPDHPQALTARGNLAQLQAALGNLPTAISNTESVLVDVVRIYGPTHPETLILQVGLAHLQAEIGLVEPAKSLLAELIPVIEAALGAEHPHLMSALAELANVQSSAGEDQLAMTTMRGLLSTMRRTLPGDHPELLSRRFDLAQYELAAGNIERAKTELRALIVDQERLRGPRAAKTLLTRFQLLQVELGDGGGDSDKTDALSRGELLLQDIDGVLGPSHIQSLLTRQLIAFNADISAESFETAFDEIRTIIADMKDALPEDHELVFDTRDNTAAWLNYHGRHAEAITELTALIDDIERAGGPEDSRVLAARLNRATIRLEHHQEVRAREELEQLLILAVAVLGADHSLTRATRDALASTGD